jgi:outer membrane protein OmpA-like peptidoglycan-associated protein
MQRIIFLILAVAAFGALCFYCLRTHSLEIQQDVTSGVTQALAGDHLATQGIKVDGRDVQLSGAAGTPEISEAAQKLAASVDGVRVVTVSEVSAADATPDARTIAVKTETQGKLNALLADHVVEFDPASAQLTMKGRSVLDQVAPMLAAAPSLLCEIQGHTDSKGSAKANEALSFKRAVATKSYLISKGIAPERLLPRAFGDTQPIASNDTAAGRQLNRRINFLLKEKP